MPKESPGRERPSVPHTFPCTQSGAVPASTSRKMPERVAPVRLLGRAAPFGADDTRCGALLVGSHDPLHHLPRRQGLVNEAVRPGLQIHCFVALGAVAGPDAEQPLVPIGHQLLDQISAQDVARRSVAEVLVQDGHVRTCGREGGRGGMRLRGTGAQGCLQKRLQTPPLAVGTALSVVWRVQTGCRAVGGGQKRLAGLTIALKDGGGGVALAQSCEASRCLSARASKRRAGLKVLNITSGYLTHTRRPETGSWWYSTTMPVNTSSHVTLPDQCWIPCNKPHTHTTVPNCTALKKLSEHTAPPRRPYPRPKPSVPPPLTRLIRSLGLHARPRAQYKPQTRRRHATEESDVRDQPHHTHKAHRATQSVHAAANTPQHMEGLLGA